MSKVKIQGNASGTGVVTLTAPNTNTDRTITLPDGDITLGESVIVAASDPAVESEGKLLYNTTDDLLKVSDGTAWNTVYNPPTKITVNGTTYASFEAVGLTLDTQGFYTVSVDKDCTVNMKLWGAGGAGGQEGSNSGATSYGAAGGYVTGDVTLSAGTSYTLLVGEGGSASAAVDSFPDGGLSLNDGNHQGGGGGSSRFGTTAQSGFNITNTSSSYNNTSAVYLLIAGAGAGGTAYATSYSNAGGGWGGGTSGQEGGYHYAAQEPHSTLGKEGTQSSGGAAGTGGRQGNATAGAKYSGGDGAGGAGGGGYYGGGGANGYYSQGGGGSGYIHSTGVSNSSFGTTAIATFSTAPNSSPGTSGDGGAYGSAGEDGAVTITFVP